MYSILESSNSDILSDYVDLLPKLQVLKHEILTNNILKSIANNLLNIGNSTFEIICLIHRFIPLLRKLDSSCFLLDSCLKEVKGYFKNCRKDLGGALLQFLLQNKEKEFNMKDFDAQKSKKISFLLEYPPNSDFLAWKPDPIFIKTYIDPALKTTDPINLVISNLTSTPLVEEYQKSLSKRLLKIENASDIDRIVQEIEILRIKCGDSFVNSAKIMLNDVIESKTRLSLKNEVINVTIISHRYWPELSESLLEHPESISNNLEIVKKNYASEQSDKKIIWRPQLDEVKLELEFQSGTYLFSCPIESAILMSSFEFPMEDEFDIKTLIAYTGIMDGKVLKSALAFWLKRKIIIPSSNAGYNFKFADDYDPEESLCVDSHLTVYEAQDAERYADDDDESNEDFTSFQEKYWPIISNMFKTFGQISAERIQSTLKMYSKEYKEPVDRLTKYLQSRVKEGILQSSGNRIILYSNFNK